MWRTAHVLPGYPRSQPNPHTQKDNNKGECHRLLYKYIIIMPSRLQNMQLIGVGNRGGKSAQKDHIGAK